MVVSPADRGVREALRRLEHRRLLRKGRRNPAETIGKQIPETRVDLPQTDRASRGFDRWRSQDGYPVHRNRLDNRVWRTPFEAIQGLQAVNISICQIFILNKFAHK